MVFGRCLIKSPNFVLKHGMTFLFWHWHGCRRVGIQWGHCAALELSSQLGGRGRACEHECVLESGRDASSQDYLLVWWDILTSIWRLLQAFSFWTWVCSLFSMLWDPRYCFGFGGQVFLHFVACFLESWWIVCRFLCSVSGNFWLVERRPSATSSGCCICSSHLLQRVISRPPDAVFGKFPV